MATEDKLKYFYNSTMSAIKQKNDTELDALRKNLESDIEYYKKKINEDALTDERLHRNAAKRELLKKTAFEKLEIRRNIAEKEAQIKDELFKEAEKILNDYRSTPQYIDTLTELVNCAVKFADGEPMDLYICPADEQLLDSLKQRTGQEIMKSDVNFAGGIQAAIPDRNIFINYSFSSQLEAEKEAYVVKP